MPGGGIVLGEESIDDGLSVSEGGGDDGGEAVEVGGIARGDGDGHFDGGYRL